MVALTERQKKILKENPDFTYSVSPTGKVVFHKKTRKIDFYSTGEVKSISRPQEPQKEVEPVTVSSTTTTTTTEKQFTKKDLEKLSKPEKALVTTHTFLSPSGFKLLSVPVQNVASKITSRVEPISFEDVVVERVEQTRKESKGKTTKQKFIKGSIGGLQSPPGVFLTSELVGGFIGYGASTKLGSKLVSSELFSAGLTTADIFGTGIAVKSVGKSLKEGEVAEAFGESLAFGTALAGGYKGFKKGQEFYDVKRTRGMTQIPIEDLVPEDVLFGGKNFPEAGKKSDVFTMKLARQHEELFLKRSQRLPGQKRPVGYHATGSEWDDLVSLPGYSELPGTYVSYGVSPHFTEIPKKSKYKLFGKSKSYRPTVYAFEPSGFNINIPEKIPGKKSKPLGFRFTQPTEKGMLQIPAKKTEIEGIFPVGTRFKETRSDFYFELYGRRVPIKEARALSTPKLENEITSLSKPKKLSRTEYSLESMGTKTLITPESSFFASVRSSAKSLSGLSGFPDSSVGKKRTATIAMGSSVGKRKSGSPPISPGVPFFPPIEPIITSSPKKELLFSELKLGSVSKKRPSKKPTFLPPPKPPTGKRFKDLEIPFKMKRGKARKPIVRQPKKYRGSLLSLLGGFEIRKPPKGIDVGLGVRPFVKRKR